MLQAALRLVLYDPCQLYSCLPALEDIAGAIVLAQLVTVD